MEGDIETTGENEQLFFVCVSGPDEGRAVEVAGKVLVGRAAECDLRCGDDAVLERHLSLSNKGGVVRFTCKAGAEVLFEDRSRRRGVLSIDQFVQVGGSVWKLMRGVPRPQTREAGEAISAFMSKVTSRISQAAGVSHVEGHNFRRLFSGVFKRRSLQEAEERITVGTGPTTPALADIGTDWPRPWLFVRTLLFAAVVYGLFLAGYRIFNNWNLVPGLIIVGSFGIPLTMLVFFYEVNTPRNISVYQILKYLAIGGILSLFVSLIIFELTPEAEWVGWIGAGIIEETGKLLVLLLIVNRLRYRWTLNGLVFGATVGVGFGAFESAGYALRTLLNATAQISERHAFNVGLNVGFDVMVDNILLRGVLSILGLHITWTAMVGAALWKVRGNRRFELFMLREPQFYRVFLFAVFLHMAWNAPIELPDVLFYLKFAILGFVAWAVILGLIQDGLKQVREAQETESEEPSEPMEATPA